MPAASTAVGAVIDKHTVDDESNIDHDKLQVSFFIPLGSLRF